MVAHHPLSLNNVKPFTPCGRKGGTLSFIVGIPCSLYRVSQEECEILWESVPYVKLY